MDTTAYRLLRLFRLYPDYFNCYLSRYYPFTKEEIREYVYKLNWIELSSNKFLDWNEELLMEFEEYWDWFYITRNILGIKGLSNPQLIKKYIDKGLLIEQFLKDNENIEWTKDMVLEFGLETEFKNKKINKFFKCDLSKVTQIMNRLEEEHQYLKEELGIEYLRGKVYLDSIADDVDIEWSDEIIDKYIDQIDFSGNKEHGSYYGTNQGGYPWQYKYEVTVSTKSKEIEEIISLIEKYGDKLIPPYYNDNEFSSPYLLYMDRDYFLFDNPLGIGVDFTFNTEEKRKILSGAVKQYYMNDDKLLIKNQDSIFIGDEDSGERRGSSILSGGLYFKYMADVGYIQCLTCNHQEKVISSLHGNSIVGSMYDNEEEINWTQNGYQCQSCGKFHELVWRRGIGTDTLASCECGGVLQNNKPIFCPRCKSKNIKYKMIRMT